MRRSTLSVQQGHLSAGEIPKTPAETAAYLGVSESDAIEMYDAVRSYSGSSYRAIRAAQRGESKSESDIMKAQRIEAYIDAAPKWAGGTTYRGIGLDAKDVAAISVGKVFDVNGGGSASWSTTEGVARSFANWESSKTHVVFVSETQRRGTSIKHISRHAHEDEVLVSMKSRYEVSSISKRPGSPYMYVYVKEV